MKMKYCKDSIGIEIEIDEHARVLKQIVITDIDTDVFPVLAVSDKTKMDWLVDALSRKIMAVLSDARFLEKVRPGPRLERG